MDSIKIYELDSLKAPRGGANKLGSNQIQLYLRNTGKKGGGYSTVFSKDFDAIKKGYLKFNFAKNELTSDVFVVFSKERGVLLKKTSGNNYNVSSKSITELLFELLDIKLDENGANLRFNLSENKSKKEDQLVYRINY